MRRNHVSVTAIIVCVVIFTLTHLFRRATDPSIESLEQRRQRYSSISKNMRPYEAPTHLCDSETRVSNNYAVFLNLDYSLEQHKQTVSEHVDLDAAIKYVFPATERRGLYYSTESLDDDDLAAMRADIGVDMVECSPRAWLIGDVHR